MLILLAFSLPVYRPWVSLGAPLFALVWLVRGDLRARVASLRHHLPTLAVVDEKRCSGCGLCVKDCPFQAIHAVARNGRQVVEVNEELMEKYLEGEELSRDELHNAFEQALRVVGTVISVSADWASGGSCGHSRSRATTNADGVTAPETRSSANPATVSMRAHPGWPPGSTVNTTPEVAAGT